MRRGIVFGTSAALAVAIGIGFLGCGGGGAGQAAVVGFGNIGNRLSGDDISEELAEALAESEGVPAVSDDTLAAIFGAIVTRARNGDPEAALIVLRTAEAQREEDAG